MAIAVATQQSMPNPDYQALMLPVLTVAAEGATRVPAAAETVADRLGLSDEEREEMLPSGKQRVLHNRIHWAKFYMTKAGLIASPPRRSLERPHPAFLAWHREHCFKH